MHTIKPVCMYILHNKKCKGKLRYSLFPTKVVRIAASSSQTHHHILSTKLGTDVRYDSEIRRASCFLSFFYIFHLFYLFSSTHNWPCVHLGTGGAPSPRLRDRVLSQAPHLSRSKQQRGWPSGTRTHNSTLSAPRCVTTGLKPDSHRHRIGYDGPTKVIKLEILAESAGFFAVCTRQKVQATLGIRPFRPEFRTLLTFVGPSYPILWRCEPDLTWPYFARESATDFFFLVNSLIFL